MTPLHRRDFLRRAAGFAGAAVITPSIAPLSRHAALLAGGSGHEGLTAGAGEGGYGPLRAAGPDLTLPDGFQYVRLGVEGSPMSTGEPTPGRHDGMAAFPGPDGLVRLIRNHEEATDAARARHFGNPDRAYDPLGPGGTTTLDVRIPDWGGAEVVRDFPSLNGTLINCAGGPTPWGSWLTCEETTRGETHGYVRPHGYIFEVPAAANEEVEPVPLRAMGRFVHEALAVDPETWIVYHTEDARYNAERGWPGSGFYRSIPEERGVLRSGSRLQVLAVDGSPVYHTISGQTPGERLPAVWLDIDEPDPPEAEADPGAVFKEGIRKGAARFDRLEGAWWGDGGVFFHSTNGGDARLGQVWHYRPLGPDHGELVLVFESPDGDLLRHPDNITVSPRGGIVLCEDSDRNPYLRGLTPDGRIFDFAQNIANEIELAGACFSPDGRVLFVNMQGRMHLGFPGVTFAIWGPWENGAL